MTKPKIKLFSNANHKLPMLVQILLKMRSQKCWGTWVAQSVKCPTLAFGSGHDLMVHETEHHMGLCVDSTDTAWDSLSLSLCPSHSCALPLSQNKLKKKSKMLKETTHIIIAEILITDNSKYWQGCRAPEILTVLVGIQNSIVILEKSLAIRYKLLLLINIPFS